MVTTGRRSQLFRSLVRGITDQMPQNRYDVRIMVLADVSGNSGATPESYYEQHFQPEETPPEPALANRLTLCSFPLSNELAQAWRDFQTVVGEFNGAARGELRNSRIIDWLTDDGRAIEAKFVQYIQNTAQLRDFIKIYGDKFELWISDYTKSISPSLLKQIDIAGGKVVELVNGVDKELNIQELMSNGGKILENAGPVIDESRTSRRRNSYGWW